MPGGGVARILRVVRRPHLALLWGSQVFSAMGDYLYTIAVVSMAVRIVVAWLDW